MPDLKPPLPQAHSHAPPQAHQPLQLQLQPAHITGLVLAGGRGSRMGGVDKGLQLHQGQPLAQHALQRLRPQVGGLLVNANRHPEVYAGFGVPVCADLLPPGVPAYPGPLAGMLAGLAQCPTPWLVTVPCDSPHFPSDLVARLAAGLMAEGAELAVATTVEDGRVQPQPVFCLLGPHLADSLSGFIASGQARIGAWLAQHRCARVHFDDAAAFANANTPEELARLQALTAPPPAPRQTPA